MLYDRELDELFTSFFGKNGFKLFEYPGTTIRMGNVLPDNKPPIRYDHTVEYIETDEGCEFKIFAVGVKKEDIKVKLESMRGLDILKISGKTGDYFIRTFQNTIKFRPDYKRVECELNLGILTVKLYKDKKENPDTKIVWK